VFAGKTAFGFAGFVLEQQSPRVRESSFDPTIFFNLRFFLCKFPRQLFSVLWVCESTYEYNRAVAKVCR
jgi:hypothetical protein